MKLGEESKGKVVLFFPILWEPQFPMWAPLSLYAIASALLHGGYEVILIDERVDPNPREQLISDLEGALFVGIAGKAGDQCKRMEEVARLVKSKRPEVPVLVGGWFPALYPRQTMTSENIDILVAGPGDAAIIEVADRLVAGRSLKGVERVYFKQNGQVIENPIGNLPPIEDTKPFPWELLGIKRYLHPYGWINFFTSRGCPGGCTFCGVICLDPRRWTGLSPERVVDDMQVLVEKVGVKAFQIMDTDFCASLNRVERICRLIIERGLKIRFNILGRHYTIRRISDEQLRLLRLAGCNEIEVGLETGSQKISDRINKQCKVNEFVGTIRRYVAAGIRMRVNIMVGLPEEGHKDLRETFRIMLELRKLGPLAVRFQMFRFTPIPDAPDGRAILSMRRRGHDGKVDLSYEELLVFPINEESTNMFWLDARQERDVKRAYEFYAPLVFYKMAFDVAGNRPLLRWALKLSQKIAMWRVARGIYSFPIEMLLNRKFGVPMPRGADEGISPVVDQLPIPPEMGQSLDPSPGLPMPDASSSQKKSMSPMV